MTTISTTISSSGTWTAPVGISSVSVDVYGGGGGGANGDATHGGSGGGSGGFGRKTLAVTTREACTVVIGTGGAHDADGVTSSFTCAAGSVTGIKGGKGRPTSIGTGGSGTGTTTHKGGDGGISVQTSAGGGGGGGGSPSASADGGNGSPAVLTVGGAGGTGTSTGGTGGTFGGSVNGTNGAAPSAGGGGGAAVTGVGGQGAAGKAIVSYTADYDMKLWIADDTVLSALYTEVGARRCFTLGSGTYNASNHLVFDAGDQAAVTAWLNANVTVGSTDMIMLDDESVLEAALPAAGIVTVMQSIVTFVKAARPTCYVCWYSVLRTDYHDHAAAAAFNDSLDSAGFFSNVDAIVVGMYDTYRSGDDTDASINDPAWFAFGISEAIDLAGDKPVYLGQTNRTNGSNLKYGMFRLSDTEFRSDLRTSLAVSHSGRGINGVMMFMPDVYYSSHAVPTNSITRIAAEIPHGKTLTEHLTAQHTHFIRMLADEVLGINYAGIYPADDS